MCFQLPPLASVFDFIPYDVAAAAATAIADGTILEKANILK